MDDSLEWNMNNSFSVFKKQFENKIKNAKYNEAYKQFAIEEFHRFHSIAGTINESFSNIKMNDDVRACTHIWLRSLLENYFRLEYIFDKNEENERRQRFQKIINSFKSTYQKLLNEPNLPHKDKLMTPPENEDWSNIPNGLDIRSMLDQLLNDHGDRLSYLYFTYRISSFDTHGNTLPVLLKETLNDNNFPFLKLDKTINLIANGYLNILNKIE